jgi:hypothetical protein
LEKISFFIANKRLCSPLGPAYLDVISKVVPKICARTNSAMLAICCPDCEGNFWTEVEGCRGGRDLLGEWKDRRPLVVEDRWEIA